jgi:hypothetical protein
MKTTLLLPLFLVLMLFTTSCDTLKGVFGKKSLAETKQATKIEDVQKAQVKNDKAKMNQVAVLASGTEYALNKVTNKEPPVVVAQDINNRVMSLAGKPDLDAEKEMWKTVDDLTSQNANLRVTGLKELVKKDKEISDIQTESKVLVEAKDVEIKNYMDLAEKTARNADTTKAALDEYKGWLGLKAVFLGLKQFLFTSMWIVLGLVVVFIVLRFASMSNPIAASIFSIFERVGSWCINTISVLAPKALDKAGQVSVELYNQSHLLLKKLVDNIQSIREIEKRTGKDITLKEVLVELDKSLDSNEKAIIDKLKKDLGY